MASLECLDCCVADVEGSVIWKLVLVIVPLLLVGYLRVVLSCKYIVGISTCRLKGHSTPRTSVAHKKALYEPTLE